MNRRSAIINASKQSSGGDEMLPAGYTRLNFLQGTYFAYDTNPYIILPNLQLRADYSYYGEVAFDENEVRNGGFARYSLLTGWQGSSNGIEIAWFDARYSFSQPERRYMFLIENRNLTINDVVVSTNLSNSIGMADFILFGYYWNGRGIVGSTMKLYRSIIKDNNGNLLYDLIPALDTQGKPCLYNTVTEQPLYNQGQGEFLYG